MSAGFVAALIGGFEGTLAEVLERELTVDLRAAVESLSPQLGEARRTINSIAR